MTNKQKLIEELNATPVFHGTVIYHDDDAEDIDFHISDLRVGTGDLPALWMSNAEATAERFSRWHSAYEQQETFAVAKCTLNIKNPYIHESGNYAELSVNGEHSEFHVAEDREELYDALLDAGYDSFIVKNNYGYQQDDIALLDDSCLKSIDAIKLSSDSETWGEYQEPETAHESFIEMVEGKE